MSADPEGKDFSNWGPKPPSQMCSRVRRECGMKSGPAQVMLLNGGGNSRCVACHLRSFAESDSMYLSHSSKPCAVGLSLPAPSFPSPLSSSSPPPSSPAPSLPLPSAFSLSSSFSLPSLFPLSLPSPSPRNPDCFSGWGWAAPVLPPLQCARGDLPQLQCAGGVGVSVRRGDVAELDVRNPSGRSGEATELDVRRPSGTNPLRFFFSRSDARIYMYSFYAPVIFCVSAPAICFSLSRRPRGALDPKPLNP